MDYVDAHVHVWTQDTTAFPAAAGFALKDRTPAHFPPEKILAHAAGVGVNRIVLIQMSFYGTDNSYMLQTISAAPQTFSGIAAVDVTDAQLPALMQRLAGAGVRGYRVSPAHMPGQDFLSHGGYDTLFDTAAELDQAVCPLIDPRQLPAVAAKCREYPDTTVIIDHLCRVGAGSTRPEGHIAEADVLALCDMARFPQVMVKVSAFYALGHGKAPYTDLTGLIHRVYDAFGPGRLMWASDCPFQVINGHTYADSFDLVSQRLPFLSDSDKQQILRDTAASFFFR